MAFTKSAAAAALAGIVSPSPLLRKRQVLNTL